jgi:hypothetical protein
MMMRSKRVGVTASGVTAMGVAFAAATPSASMAAELVTDGILFTQTTVTVARVDNVGGVSRTFDLAIWDYSVDGITAAEGATFYDGTLWLSGDADGFGNRLAGYTPASGNDLSGAPQFVQMTIPPGRAEIGFEGLTVNTGGAGYGAFTGDDVRFVGTDNSGSFIFATVDPATGIVDNVRSTVRLADLAYVPSVRQFALLNRNSPQGLMWYPADLDVVEPIPTTSILATQPVANGGLAAPRGMTVIPDGVASFLLGETVASGEYLLVSSQGSVQDRRLGVYGIDLSTDTGFIFLGAFTLDAGIDPSGDIESLAYDPVHNRLYLIEDGATFFDDATGQFIENARIYSFVVPEPTTLMAVAIGATGLLARRRRRA